MRFWCRWEQPTDDERPLTYPPNEAVLGWWRSGWKVGGEKDVAILCAIISAKNEEEARAAILKDWPEAVLDNANAFVNPQKDDFLPGDRFPLDNWMKKRVKP